MIDPWQKHIRRKGIWFPMMLDLALCTTSALRATWHSCLSLGGPYFCTPALLAMFQGSPWVRQHPVKTMQYQREPLRQALESLEISKKRAHVPGLSLQWGLQLQRTWNIWSVLIHRKPLKLRYSHTKEHYAIIRKYTDLCKLKGNMNTWICL